MSRRRNSGVAWASIVGAHTPNVGSAGDAEVGQEEAGGLLQEGLLVLAGEALAAVLGRPGDAGVAGLEQPALEGALARRAPRATAPRGPTA